MNQHCAIHQQSSFAGYGEEMMMRRHGVVVCPKPVRPLRWHVSQQQDWCDTQAANELFDIILAKGASGGVEQQSVSSMVPVASSPPFFCGSPPSRVSNPIIQDARFGDENVTPVPSRAIPIPTGLGPSLSSSARKGGCLRENFGNNPAVRVEGFDCLDRDRRVGSIPAFA